MKLNEDASAICLICLGGVAPTANTQSDAQARHIALKIDFSIVKAGDRFHQ